MLHLQCTKKVLKIVREIKAGPVPLQPTLLSWHVNEFRVARRKLLLFTNDLIALTPQIAAEKNPSEVEVMRGNLNTL